MKIAARMSRKSACLFFSLPVLCAVFNGGWLQPTAVWSDVILVKKSSARPTVYLGSVTSNTSPSPTQQDCPLTDLVCQSQGNTGPVPEALKSSLADALRHEGVSVVTKKPSQDIFDEVTVSWDIRDLPANPPTIPKRYVCDVNGMIIRHGAEGMRERKELERHNASTGGSASSATTACLQPTASLVKKGITALNKPQNKKNN